jgi:hypothetical protein
MIGEEAEQAFRQRSVSGREARRAKEPLCVINGCNSAGPIDPRVGESYDDSCAHGLLVAFLIRFRSGTE